MSKHCNRCGAAGALQVESINDQLCPNCVNSALEDLKRQLLEQKSKNTALRRELRAATAQSQLQLELGVF